jgi:hypothetical protein
MRAMMRIAAAFPDAFVLNCTGATLRLRGTRPYRV